jgi:hypothetical protein
MFRDRPGVIRALFLMTQGAGLIAGWLILPPAAFGQLQLALVYVLTVWSVAGIITFGWYLAFSLAALPDLLTAAWLVAADAMWLVPGTLLVAARSPVAVAVGVVLVINSARLLASSRAPAGEKIEARRQGAKHAEPRLFGYQPVQSLFFSRETGAAMSGALALQSAIFAITRNYPLLAAASFAAATAIWVGMSVTRGAMEARSVLRKPYTAARFLLTLLCTVTLGAVLLQSEIVEEGPPPSPPVIDLGQPSQAPGMTRRVLQRLAHVPPLPAAPSGSKGNKKAVARVVDPGPGIAAEKRMGVPGFVVRPKPKQDLRPLLAAPGARLQLSPTHSLGIPFTGEYHLFQTSSRTLPPGAIVQTGSLLRSLYGTTNGSPMDTLAVQPFNPAIDLTNCGRVLVRLVSAESMPLLASLQLVTEGSPVDGGTELMGMSAVPEEVLEFQLPSTTRRLLVRAFLISFERPAIDRSQSVRVSVEEFTLVPR